MLINQKMCVKGAVTQKIVNLPLPSQQAPKFLKELQASCNSPNKATQLEALKCWGAWIQNHTSEEWDNDSVCHFAVKPLLTKKLQAFHKDADICKLKLSLLWELLSQVQQKMNLKGSQYILKIFFQSCFAWLSSIDNLDNKITILIIKLLLSLFKKFESSIVCDTYTFSPIQIDDSTIRKLFYIFNDNILDVFDYWKKVQDNSLILKLWTWFLEYCEYGHENITTSVWHRIFKVNQTFCLDHRESVQDRLIFLHACATNVKTVLLSSKYIKGESCFTTPCEALMKKFVEVCSTELEELPDWKMFCTCKDVSEVLANKSVSISNYEMCIYMLDYLEDFTYRSFFWGAWCGLVECFKKNLMNIDRQTFTSIQSKFYRKLRGVSVNFDLDRMHLTPDSTAVVQNSIEILKIECLCKLILPELNISNGDMKNDVVLLEPEEINFAKDNSPPPNLQIVKKFSFLSSGERFGNIPARTLTNKSSLTVRINFGFKKNFYEFLKSNHVMKIPFHFFFPVFNNIKAILPFLENRVQTDSKSNLKMVTYNECESSYVPCSKLNKVQKVLELEREKKETFILKTRGRKKVEEKQAEEISVRKRRKSFEILVQEIVTKNKLRKLEKKTDRKKNGVFEKNKLRSGKQLKNLEENKKLPERQLRKREPSKKANNEKMENFFKVVDSKSKQSKTTKKQNAVKKNKKEKNKIEKKNKSEIIWKQTTLVDKINSETFKKAEAKKKKNSKLTLEKNIVESSNLVGKNIFKKEALQDHKYAKPTKSSISSSLDKQSKKHTKKKKLQKKKKITEIELEQVETSIVKKGEEKTLPVLNKIMKELTPEKLKIDNHKKVHETILNKLKSETKETEKDECDNLLNTHFDYKNNKKIINNTYANTIKEKKVFSINPPTESTETLVQNRGNNPSESIFSDTQEKEIEEENVFENLDNKNLLSPKDTKRRMLLIYSPRPRKKARLDEDSLDSNEGSVDVAEKENLRSLECEPEKKREILSPIRESSAENFVAKEEISPSQKSPLFNRMTTSRALKMMALIPEPSSPIANQTNCEISSKTGLKPHLKKIIGVDKNSRVSKMLARLSESMKQEREGLANEKLLRENSPPHVSTSTAHKFVVENISPKPVKKKKFIGFDDSKNETIVFQTDTPPSQILEQRIFSISINN